ncbi:unnamed protein product [Paramecium primaurelia]|uniref:Armadillo-type fold n=1 Tax=Paramecium primaurelia TaxID=5886 RepID=A0A8S1PSM0_PARPR|nr:unnamed protein product [Paramecium primaurelia]
MKKQSEEIVNEIRKRQPDKPLSLTELAMIREIQYMYLKKEKCVLDLIIQYCCDQRFQIRVCEKAFLMTTIVPLLHSENPVDIIKSGTIIIACLSENQETHKRIIKSESLQSLTALIKKKLHYEITKYALQTIANLAKVAANFRKILEQNFLDDTQVLEQVLPNQSQLYVLQIIYEMTYQQHTYLDQMCKLMLKKRFIKKIMRSIVSADVDVATQAILIINQLIINSKKIDRQQNIDNKNQENLESSPQIDNNNNNKNLKRLLKLKLPPKLLLTYKLFQGHENSIKITKAIMQTLENLLKIKDFQQQLVMDSYYILCLQMFDTNVYELNYYGISCLAYMSELVESHDKLVEKKILELMYQILKDCKDQKIKQQAFKIISCISLNPKYLQNLINMGMIDLLVNSLNSDEKACKIYSILSLSNLSCSQNFHKYIGNINIKLLIHILELSDPSNHAVLRAAANTLANISIDHTYQQNFLKDPEKTIILKLIYSATDIILIKSIIIIFTNISTNSNLITDLAQQDILNCLFLLYQKDYEELRGYLSRCLSALSVVPECKKLILQKGFMKSLVNSIYKSNRETKRMILLSIMMMLSINEEFQKQFINEQGTECLLYLMSQSDNFHAYIAAKSFVLISRMESSLSQVARKSICESVAKYSLTRERRILKEGLRFFVNIIIHKRPKAFIINHLCFLAHEVLKGDEQDAQQLGMFAFMLLSEQQIYHETVMAHDHLLQTIANKVFKSNNTNDLKPQNATFLSIAIMNLSLNLNNLEKLLNFKFIKVMRDICVMLTNNQEKDPEFDFRTYLFTFIRQLLKIPNLQEKLPEIFKQGATQIIQELILSNKSYFFRSLLESINILISMSDKYPSDILNVIVKLADPDYEMDDEESLPLRVYVLNRMSYNPHSLEYFKQSKIVPFLSEKMQQDLSFLNISQYFCSLLANISKENEILNQIFEAQILTSIFKLRQQKHNIKLTDIIRLLAHLSSHPSFKPKIFSDEIYANIFDHLQQVTFSEKQDPQICYPVLICILNMTKSDYGLIKAIARSDILNFVKVYIKEQKGPQHITILCFLTLSNMLIDPDILKKEKDIPSLVNQLRQSIQENEDQLDPTQPDYVVVSFLKVMHNMVLQHYSEIEDNLIMIECLQDIQKMFIKFTSQEILGLILSIFCVMVESQKTLQTFKSNYPVMIKIFDLLHHNYEKLEQQEQRFRSSLLLLLANLAYHEHSFDFFETFLNIEDFMIKYRTAYLNLTQAPDRELLLTILVNLTYIKEIQLIMPKYEKTLQLIKEIFLSEHDESTTKRIVQLLANLSLNQDLHTWIASQDILKRLHKLFFESGTSKVLKEQIQILLANTTFTEEVHEVLINNEAIRIFEQIVNKKESIQQDTSHQQVVSLVNLGLNPRTYALIENQLNMVNLLSLLDECEKPLQIRLLKSSLEYVIDNSSQNLSNKKEILQQIIANINFLLESKSKFLVCKIDPLWQMILSTELINTVRFDRERLIGNFITIIIFFDMLEVKCNYYSHLCELADRIPHILDFQSMQMHIENLFIFNQNSLNNLKELIQQVKQKQQVEPLLISKYEQLVNQFLRLLSNVAFAQKTQVGLQQFMQKKEVEDHLLEICQFSHQQAPNLILQSLATYANIFQIDSRNYQSVFEIIAKNYKQQIKQHPLYQTFLIGVIVGVMKNRKYLLFEDGKQDIGDLNDSIQSYQKNALYSIQQQQTNNFFQKRVSSQQTFISIRSQDSEYPVNKDMSLIISVLLYVLKKGHPPTYQSAPPLLLQCLTNIAYHQENFKFLFSTKLPEYLFTYICQKENIQADGYVHALTAFINISTNKEFFLRIQAEEVYKYVVKLNQVSKPLVIQYSSSIFMQMFEYSTENDENQHLVEFTLDFMVNEVLSYVTFESDHMDLFLAFLERLLKIQKLKYKIAKIESLFQKFQKTLETQDLTNDKKFDKYWRIWNIYNFLITSKECLNYLVKYGYFSLLKSKLSYFTSSQFDQCLSYNTQAEYQEKHRNVLKQFQLFSIVLSSIEKIFKNDVNLKLQPPIQKLIYSQRNEKVSTDIIRINDNEALKISFYVPFLIIEKILLSEETYQNQNNILIVVEVLNQIALILTRMDSNGDMTLKFLIEILKRTLKTQVEDKTLFYSNVVNISIKLFEKFGVDISGPIEEILVLFIQHWQGSEFRFMNSEIYQNFLRLCVLFKFKDCQQDKPCNLANSVLQIMNINQTTFREHETQLLFQMFLKKLIAEVDPSESQELEETISESIDFLLDYIQKQSANIKAQLEMGDKSVTEYQKTLQQQNFTMSIEILTILVSFTSFQEKILDLELLSSTVQCGLLIQELLNFFENKEQQSEDLKTAINQLQSFLKHISIFLSYTSFLIKFHDELQSQPCIQFIFENMLKRKKQTKIFCFNIIVNLIESQGPNFIFEVLQSIEEQIDKINANNSLQKYSLDAIVSLTEEIYQKIQHYKTIAPNEEAFYQLSDDIGLLLTKILIGKKHSFSLNGSAEILMNSKLQQVQIRTLFLMIKKFINCDNDIAIRDKSIQLSFDISKQIYGMLSSMEQIDCNNETIQNQQFQSKFINIKYTWDQVRKNQTYQHLEDMFFWEQLELSDYQFKLIFLIICFENITCRFRGEQNNNKIALPNSAIMVNDIFLLIDPNLDTFLENYNLQNQLNFLLVYYAASISYSSLGNRTRKIEFQQLAERDMSFRIRLNTFVRVLSDSKINILANFADLIRGPIQNL